MVSVDQHRRGGRRADPTNFGFENYWKRQGKPAKFSYASDPEKIRQTWTAYIRKWHELAGDRVIWQLGLRGRGDVPAWASDKAMTEAQAGQFISSAIADQYAIVKSIDIRPQPPATTTLWHEGSKLMSQGGLKFPPGITSKSASRPSRASGRTGTAATRR